MESVQGSASALREAGRRGRGSGAVEDGPSVGPSMGRSFVCVESEGSTCSMTGVVW